MFGHVVMCLGEFPDMLILESIDRTAPDLSNAADIMQSVDGLSKTRGWRKWELLPRQETFSVLVSV